MEIRELELSGVLLITPKKWGDNRGFFAETFRDDKLVEAGFTRKFTQDNQSLSAQVGTLRGLHFQTPPMAQDKLIRVVRGSILDVAVDIRHGSPTFGQHVAVELSAENFQQLLVPQGFAHGFVTREPDTEVVYKCSNYYSPECDGGIAWDDPALGIDWGLGDTVPELSDKDKVHPTLADLGEVFTFEG